MACPTGIGKLRSGRFQMSLTTFSFPTPTLFGAGALAELPRRSQVLGMKRPLVVTDSGLVNTDSYRKLVAVLGEAAKDKNWFVYSGVHPNPVEDDVREAARSEEHTSELQSLTNLVCRLL